MNKRDIVILGILILLVLMWPMVGPLVERQLFPRPDVESVDREIAEPSAPRPVGADPDTGEAAPVAPPAGGEPLNAE